ncbi:MAG: alpha/beta fold hydrolase [Syntrophobacteraceae bacterium]
MPFCTCGDISLYYETVGNGFPVLLLSGLSGGTWSWFGQIPELSEHYRVVSFDNRGAGQSGMPRGPYRMVELAGDALCLLDHLQIERAFVLGLSMGGMIAQELALLSPGRVQALVLGCTHSGGPTRFAPPAYALSILMNNDGLSQAEIVEKNMPLFLSEECLKTRPDVVAAYRQALLSPPPQPDHAFRAQLAAIAGFDCSHRLNGIEAPTLIVTGSRDVLVPRENAYFLAQNIAGAQLVEIQGVGHALHVECRDQLNDLAHRFFQGQLRRGGLERRH